MNKTKALIKRVLQTEAMFVAQEHFDLRSQCAPKLARMLEKAIKAMDEAAYETRQEDEFVSMLLLRALEQIEAIANDAY